MPKENIFLASMNQIKILVGILFNIFKEENSRLMCYKYID